MYVCVHIQASGDCSWSLSVSPTKPTQTKSLLLRWQTDRATEGAFCPASTDEFIGNSGRANRQTVAVLCH